MVVMEVEVESRSQQCSTVKKKIKNQAGLSKSDKLYLHSWQVTIMLATCLQIKLTQD